MVRSIGLAYFFFYDTVYRKFIGGVAVIVGDDGYFVAQLNFIFLHIAVDIFTNVCGDTSLKVVQGILPGIRDRIIRSVADFFKTDHAGLRELREHGLQCEK